MQVTEKEDFKIEYEFTEEDYCFYNLYQHWHKPEKKWLRWRFSFYPLLLFASILLALGKPVVLYDWPEFLFLGLGVLFFFLLDPLVVWNNKRIIQKTIKKGKNANMLGWRSLFFYSEQIISKTENFESVLQWAAMDSLKETADYFMLFINSTQAFVIPKRVFDDLTEQQNFRNYILGKLQ